MLPLNGFGSNNLILICYWFLFANGAHTGIMAGVVIVYTGMKKNSMNGPACYSAIIASSFTKLWKNNKYIYKKKKQ